MTTLSPNWNTDLNYWDLHPSMLTIRVFSDFYSNDKSKNKSVSSKVMWAIALFVDPNEKNPWRNTNPLDRKKLISEDFLREKNFDWSDKTILALIEEYKERCLTIAEKALVEFEEKLADRARFIADTKYTLDYYLEDEKTGKIKIMKGTADQLDKMMADTKKIYDYFATIKKQLDTEAVHNATKGGAIESAGEKGEL